MAVFTLEEQEQIADLRYFWRGYGRWLALILLILAVGFGGYQYWQFRQAQRIALYANEYAALVQLDSAEGKDLAAIQTATLKLQSTAPQNIYTTRATQLLAKNAAAKGDLVLAEKQLRWILANQKQADLVILAKLSLVSVLVDNKQAPAALALLNEAPLAGYEAVLNERKGDVLAFLGKKTEAKTVYTLVLKGLDKEADAGAYALLSQKIDSLGE